MVAMMMGRGKKKSVLDLLSDPEQLKSTIKAHENIIDARNKAAQEFNKRKSEAFAAIEELRNKEDEHDARHAELNQREKAYDEWVLRLNSLEDKLESSIAVHEKAKSDFEAEKALFFDDANKKNIEFSNKQHEISTVEATLQGNQRKLDQLLSETAAREKLVKEKEDFLLSIIEKLKV